jgi:hypothetical protein
MNAYLKFDPHSYHQFPLYGLSVQWLASLFLGANVFETVPSLLDGMPASQRHFINRETLASDTTYVSVQNRVYSCLDPWIPDAHCEALVCLTGDEQGSLPVGILPVYYGCRSATGEEFWVCVYALYGRITQVYFPSRSLVVFEMSQGAAESVIGSLHSVLSRYGTAIPMMLDDKPRSGKCVGLLEMVTNFGHQAINHLSGLQRLVDFGLIDNLDELWTSGTHFFGRIETMFPELHGRVRYFAHRWEIAKESIKEPHCYVRIGSTYLSKNLKNKILKRARINKSVEKSNILVVTVRATGRACVNLPEVVGELYKNLQSSHELKIAFDGWVLPESALVAGSSLGAALSKQYLNAIRDEIVLATEIAKRLPAGAVVANTIGRSLFESLADLSDATAYFSHVGTLQHKLGMLLNLRGVVHAPRSQLSKPNGGPFLSEDGMPPTFIPESAVEDIPTVSRRGKSFSDYRILDVSVATEILSCLFRGGNSPGTARSKHL